MSLRITIALLFIAGVVGVFAYINPFRIQEPKVDKRPWFYQIAQEDIRIIEVSHIGKYVKFVKNGKTWTFEEPTSFAGLPPAWEIFQGTELILSGPRTQRDLTIAAETIDDPTQYGLDDPNTIVDVELTENRNLRFKLGDPTPNGDYYYGEIEGFPQLYLVVKIWGDVVSRLANEPPIPIWYAKREIDTLHSVSIFRSDIQPEKGKPIIEFLQVNSSWTIRDWRTSEEVPYSRPVDLEKWQPIIPLLEGSPNIRIENVRVEDEDYSRWGIDEEGNSSSIEFRFPVVSEYGTTHLEHMSLLIGNKTSDNSGYYALWESSQFFRPTIILDANWVETFLGLFEDTP